MLVKVKEITDTAGRPVEICIDTDDMTQEEYQNFIKSRSKRRAKLNQEH